MPIADSNDKEICFHIMYYGLPLSGRTSALEVIHERVANYICCDFTFEKIVNHRGYWYFEFISPKKINGVSIRYKLLRSPSFHSCFICRHHMTIDDYIGDMEIVLEKVDGVVFVVDSRQKCLEDNIGALNLLRDVVQKKELEFCDLLLTINWNKRDMESVGLVDINELETKINNLNIPSYETSAFSEGGIIASFKKCTEIVENRYLSKLETIA